MTTLTKRSLATILCFLWTSAAWAQPEPVRDCDPETPINSQRSTVLPNNKIFPIDVGGDRLNILLHWDDIPGTDTAPADGIPDIAQTLVNEIDTTLNRFADAGFRKITGIDKCEITNVFTAYIYQAVGDNNAGGVANRNRFDYRFTRAHMENGEIVARARNTVVHELFHSIQFAYNLTDFQKWFVEGTAKLIPDVFDPEIDASKVDLPSGLTSSVQTCEEQLLAAPHFSITRRNGKFEDTTNECQSKIFWRYFMEQIGTASTEPGIGIDALVDLFELMSDEPKGWRIQDTDEIVGAGDFDGDGREELLLRSGTHIGLISAVSGENRILNVTGFGSELGAGGWKLDRDDDLRAVADFNGDGKAEFLISSNSHIGFVGLDATNQFRTLDSVLFGRGRFGDGWVPKTSDRFLGVADLNGDGSDDVVLKSADYLGVVGLTSRNESQTIAARAKGGLGRAVRALEESARSVGDGRLTGQNREELLLRDRQGFYVLGTNPDGSFSVAASANYRDLIRSEDGADWRFRRDDIIRGIGDLAINDLSSRSKDEIIIQHDQQFAILSLTGDNFKLQRSYNADALLFDGSTISSNLELVAVESIDDDPQSELVYRQGINLGILDTDPVSLDLTRVGLIQNNLLPSGRITLAHMNGGNGAHIIVRNTDLWQTYAHYPAPGLIYEAYVGVGVYFDDLISRMDELIVAKTGGTRDFATLWRDFSIALYTKNLDVSSLTSEYYFIDEQNGEHQYHYNNSPQPGEPPVATVLDSTDFGLKEEGVKSNRWSANYARVYSKTNRQEVLLNIVPERGTGRVSANVVITEGDQLIRIEKDVNPRGGLLLKSYILEPGQELGLIIATTYDASDYTIRIQSSPVP